MHIEAYEWALYLNRALSERRMSEIEAHLESCDRCLEAYAALASGEARLEAAVKPARGSFWRVFANRRRRPVFAMAAAALCVLLVVLSTPGGKIVWGQFTRTLREWFAIQSHPELVETLDVPAVSHHGVEMKLSEVLIEDNRVYFSLLVTIDPESPIRSIGFRSMPDSLTIGDISFDVVEDWRSYSSSMNYDPSEKESPSMIVFHSDIPAQFLDEGLIPMRLVIDGIYAHMSDSYEDFYGPWVFDFMVDGTKAKELTRVIPLDHEFRDAQSTYHVSELVFSPIRAKISVFRTIAKEKKHIKIYNWVLSFAIPHGNLAGFIIDDNRGNQVEIALIESDLDTESHEKMESVFFSDGANNGWEWLKDAESVTLTPYVITLAGLENEAEGIAQYHAMEPFTVNLKQEESK